MQEFPPSPCEYPRVEGAPHPFSSDPWSEEPESHPFLARAELRELLFWWQAGASEPVVVEGSPGIGKTALLRLLAREVAHELGNPDAIHMHSLAWLRSLRLASVPDPEELVSQLRRQDAHSSYSMRPTSRPGSRLWAWLSGCGRFSRALA
jgi:hypothetical protein